MQENLQKFLLHAGKYSNNLMIPGEREKDDR
jgi:hypothetical protein